MSAVYPGNNDINIMIDLETLGLKPGCQVLAIGAVAWDKYGLIAGPSSAFMSTVSTNAPYGLTQDKDTVDWWQMQDEGLRLKMFGGINLLPEVLTSFSIFLDAQRAKGRLIKVWGNAASLDLKILDAAYEATNIPVPWTYKEEMCFRTLKNLTPLLSPPPFEGIKHHPLADAKNQAEHAHIIMSTLRLY